MIEICLVTHKLITSSHLITEVKHQQQQQMRPD